MRWRIARITLVVLGVAGLLQGHLAMTLVAIIALSVIFAAPESVAIGIAYDLLWTQAPLSAVPWLTLCALAMLWASEPIRREILR